ncbi:hypothetical protein ACETK8_06630 [Brevundimonas staleyi]|uniref:DUF3617 family protein n=1 Tax=Brevundimonas staleyi TaxID=74326 RepID=A0ABW0FMV4_9CAUL
MLTALALSLVLQQAAGSAVVWATPAPEPEPVEAVEVVAETTLPDWAVADPFGWERSQCNPMIRGETPLETCQARVRSELFAALGDRLPAGLRPPGEPVPCLATPGEDGGYAVQCGAPERQAAAVVTPRIQDCRSRPTRHGGSVSFTTDCRTDDQRSEGLSFRLFGKD